MLRALAAVADSATNTSEPLDTAAATIAAAATTAAAVATIAATGLSDGAIHTKNQEPENGLAASPDIVPAETLLQGVHTHQAGNRRRKFARSMALQYASIKNRNLRLLKTLLCSVWLIPVSTKHQHSSRCSPHFW